MDKLIAGCKTRSHNAGVITAIKSCHVMRDLLATDAQGYCVTAAGHAWVGGQLESKECTSVPCGTCALFSFKPDTPKPPNTPEGFWY